MANNYPALILILIITIGGAMIITGDIKNFDINTSLFTTITLPNDFNINLISSQEQRTVDEIDIRFTLLKNNETILLQNTSIELQINNAIVNSSFSEGISENETEFDGVIAGYIVELLSTPVSGDLKILVSGYLNEELVESGTFIKLVSPRILVDPVVPLELQEKDSILVQAVFKDSENNKIDVDKALVIVSPPSNIKENIILERQSDGSYSYEYTKTEEDGSYFFDFRPEKIGWETPTNIERTVNVFEKPPISTFMIVFGMMILIIIGLVIRRLVKNG